LDIREILKVEDLMVEVNDRAVSAIVEATDQFYLETLENCKSLLKNLHKQFDKDMDLINNSGSEDYDTNVNIYIFAFEDGTTELYVTVAVGNDYWDEERIKVTDEKDAKALFERVNALCKREEGKSVSELILSELGPEKKVKKEVLER
jgi:hypothetical protein